MVVPLYLNFFTYHTCPTKLQTTAEATLRRQRLREASNLPTSASTLASLRPTSKREAEGQKLPMLKLVKSEASTEPIATSASSQAAKSHLDSPRPIISTSPSILSRIKAISVSALSTSPSPSSFVRNLRAQLPSLPSLPTLPSLPSVDFMFSGIRSRLLNSRIVKGFLRVLLSPLLYLSESIVEYLLRWQLRLSIFIGSILVVGGLFMAPIVLQRYNLGRIEVCILTTLNTGWLEVLIKSPAFAVGQVPVQRTGAAERGSEFEGGGEEIGLVGV